MYNLYLQHFQSETYYPEFITNLVSKQAAAVVNSTSYEAHISPHPDEASMRFAVNGKYIARIVEGCNAVSVILLFISFILAFHQKLKPTLLYIFTGTVLIYAVNIFRIAFFTIALYRYPQYRDVLHDIIFPGIIYGMVFILWFLWIKRLPGKTAQDE